MGASSRSDELHTIPELTNIYSDLRLGSPREDVHIDRNLALALGVTPDVIANTLYDAYGNRRVTTITAVAISMTSYWRCCRNISETRRRCAISTFGLIRARWCR